MSANDLDLTTDESLTEILADADRMPALLAYLRVVNECEEGSLAPIKAHYNLANTIKEKEEAKKQAVMDEEFEIAAKLKKEVIALKD